MLTEVFAALLGYPFLMLRLTKAEGSFPKPLTREKEQEYLEAAAGGDLEARNRLIEHNLRLVVFLARRFENTGVNIEDLISIGTIGLIKALGAYRKEILHRRSRAGRPYLHRHHRAHKGNFHLQFGEGCPACHLCQPVYRKRDTYALPLRAENGSGRLSLGHSGIRR